MKKMSWKPPFYKHKKKVFEKVLSVSSFIHQIGESDNLRKPSAQVPLATITSQAFQKKVQYLKSCMRKYRKLTGAGRGITAVQIGIPECFSVIYMPQLKGNLLIVINPKITKKSKELLKYPEVCMSANPIIASVTRPAWIEFEYYDEAGKKQHWNIKADTKEGTLYNRVFQHEIDHMHGIINIDLVNSNTLIFESDPTFYVKAAFEKVKSTN